MSESQKLKRPSPSRSSRPGLDSLGQLSATSGMPSPSASGRKKTTSTAVVLPVVVPSPNWPPELAPQHLTPPVMVSAQLWVNPAAVAATSLLRPDTSTGVVRFVVVPSPSWPLALEPQHLRPAAAVRAQVCEPPVATATTPLARPATSTGVVRFVIVPSPSWPLVLYPQHL